MLEVEDADSSVSLMAPWALRLSDCVCLSVYIVYYKYAKYTRLPDYYETSGKLNCGRKIMKQTKKENKIKAIPKRCENEH